MDGHLDVIREIAQLAETVDGAARLTDTGNESIVSQPTEFPEPRRPSPEEEALRSGLRLLTSDQKATVAATFWLGRDPTSRPDDYPALLEHAGRDPDHLDTYLAPSTRLAPALWRGVGMLAGR